LVQRRTTYHAVLLRGFLLFLVLQKIKENPNAQIDPSLYQSIDTNVGAPSANQKG
jgi:hypothetical protein